ncbi:alpha/beta hydrolase family protein [Streptomyces sp. 8P21H-1]|uniref:alpha/beta hydrolase n=1 Tax=Streptomyces sp. 8P21H-1 TaxID=2737048 RepID=UPI00156DDC36|nr:alpha/beta hydrolase family protein [Streptomyces sp. 8P21H-1]NSL42699.1 esterase family protein [Streptomyces sp. 8P21H-1]
MDQKYQPSRRAILGVAAGTAAVAALGPPASALGVSPVRAHPTTSDPVPGLTLVGAPVRLSNRLSELTFYTDALGTTTKARVLLPKGYDKQPRRHYPVLYLFHGGGGNENHTTWTDPAMGNAEALTTGLPAIVVMPDGGAAGFYVDWYNSGAFGTPKWETYHIGQLVPWIDATYRTIPKRSARATAGLSMGGHGALAYAARHPDLIGVCASFSGAVDLNNHGLAIHVPQQIPFTQRIFGAYATDEVRWRGKNTWDLVANLANTDVSLYAGGTGATEVTINECTRAVHSRLDAIGIRHRFILKPRMSHDWQNFGSSFVNWLPHLATSFADRRNPSAFTVASVDPQYGYGDWTVRTSRDVVEFSALQAYAPRHFAVIGNDTATVVMPSLGRAGAHYDVFVKGAGRHSSFPVAADRKGRLTIPLHLGPGNPYQQFSPEADAASTAPSPDRAPFFVRGNSSRFHRVEVRVARM